MKKCIFVFAFIFGVIIEIAAIVYMRYMRERVAYGGEYLILPLIIVIAYLVIDIIREKQFLRENNDMNEEFLMYRNYEHYPDPTFGEAYLKIKSKEKALRKNKTLNIPWVYIASPYRGNVEKNVCSALSYSKFAVNQNYMPMCPHIYFTRFLDDCIEDERKKGLSLALQMLRQCKEMWVFGNKISEGMHNEIIEAKKNNIPIRYFTTDCKDVTNENIRSKQQDIKSLEN